MRLLPILLLLAAPAFAAEPPGHDQAPGQHFDIRAETLPAPASPPYVMNGPTRVARETLAPIVPEGFTVTLFAENLIHPRRLLALADGSVLLVQQQAGHVVRFIDTDANGVADGAATLASGFNNPFGLVEVPTGIWKGDLLLADVLGVYRLPLATGGEITQITPGNAFGPPEGHITRSLAIDPATGAFYVGVGSMSNLAEEAAPKASILRFDADGTNSTVFARGLRNATGLRIQPGSNALYAVVMERDAMGDGLVPDFFVHVREGDDFGWPYQYAGGFVQPEFSDGSQKRVASKLPDVMFEAHSAPMDLIFLPESWPEEFRGDAIVALKGSSNRTVPTGYKLVRIPFTNGTPAGGYDNFATGFWVSGETAPKPGAAPPPSLLRPTAASSSATISAARFGRSRHRSKVPVIQPSATFSHKGRRRRSRSICDRLLPLWEKVPNGRMRGFLHNSSPLVG